MKFSIAHLQSSELSKLYRPPLRPRRQFRLHRLRSTDPMAARVRDKKEGRRRQNIVSFHLSKGRPAKAQKSQPFRRDVSLCSTYIDRLQRARCGPVACYLNPLGDELKDGRRERPIIFGCVFCRSHASAASSGLALFFHCALRFLAGVPFLGLFRSFLSFSRQLKSIRCTRGLLAVRLASQY